MSKDALYRAFRAGNMSRMMHTDKLMMEAFEAWYAGQVAEMQSKKTHADWPTNRGDYARLAMKPTDDNPAD